MGPNLRQVVGDKLADCALEQRAVLLEVEHGVADLVPLQHEALGVQLILSHLRSSLIKRKSQIERKK